MFFIFRVSNLPLLSSDCRFSAFLPSAVACACVSIATQRLKLVDAAVSSDSVMELLANLLAIDLVRVMFNWHFLDNISFDFALLPALTGMFVIISASTLITQKKVQTVKCTQRRETNYYILYWSRSIDVHLWLSMTCWWTCGCSCFTLTLNRALSSSAMAS